MPFKVGSAASPSFVPHSLPVRGRQRGFTRGRIFYSITLGCLLALALYPTQIVPALGCLLFPTYLHTCRTGEGTENLPLLRIRRQGFRLVNRTWFTGNQDQAQLRNQKVPADSLPNEGLPMINSERIKSIKNTTIAAAAATVTGTTESRDNASSSSIAGFDNTWSIIADDVREALRKVPAGQPVFASFANLHFSEMLLNWASHLRQLGLSSLILVAALDAQAYKVRATLRLEAWK